MFSFSKISSRIRINEGYRPNIYKDKLGNPTIGYGHLINSRDTFSFGKKYPRLVLIEIFYKDLREAIIDFKKYYNYKILSNEAQEVIIEMIFQLGIKKTLKFKRFNFYIMNKQYYLAAFEMIKSSWYLQTPKRVNKLINILLQSNVRR